MRTNDARMVHWRVKQCAEEMAGAFYELRASRDDRFYREWPSVKDFIRKNWRNFVVTARQVLTSMLTKPHMSDKAKSEIYDALINDSSLPWAPAEAQVVNIPH